MGLFTNTSYNEYEAPVVNEAAYDGAVGRLNIMVEACQDDMEFFKSLIINDVNEVNALREGADLTVLAENAITDAFGKLREFIKKCWAKLKSLVKAFIARVESFVAKDGKTFSKKYGSIALKNVSDGRCKKIKYKFRKIKKAPDFLNGIEDAANVVDYKSDMVMALVKETKDNDDIKEEIMKTYGVTSSDTKEFKKDLVDLCLEDEEEEEGIEPQDITAAKQILEGNSDEIKALKKLQTSIDSTFKKMLKKCDDAQKNMDKYLSAKNSDKVSTNINSLGGDLEKDYPKSSNEKDTADNYARATKNISACRTVLTISQEVANAAIGANSEIINIKFKQARKVLGLAASATNRKKVTEAVEAQDALDFILAEEAAFEVDAFLA